MKSKSIKILSITALTVLIALGSVYTYKRIYAEGKLEAKADFQKNIYRYKVFGYHAGMNKDLNKTMKDKHQITITAVAQCIVRPNVRRQTEDYNNTMSSLLKKDIQAIYNQDFSDSYKRRHASATTAHNKK